MALHPQPSVNIISLCTGGYGLDFGVELAMPSARSVCLVEREAFGVARLVAAMREGLIPEAAIWSDARTFNGRPWRGLVDAVIGGIPCQPHSLAGRRRGADDPRDLWSIARRIIVQSGAWWCLIENVPGMLTAAKGQRAGAERVWRDLQRLGFAVEGGLFSAAEVGASHERQRLFILGVANGFGGRRWGEGDAGKQTTRAHACSGDNVADSHDAGPSIAACQPGNDGSQCAAAERVRGDVVDAIGVGRSSRRHNNRPNVGNQSDATGKHTLVNAKSLGRREGWPEPELSQRNWRSLANPIGEVDVATRPDGNVATTEERFEESDDRRPGRTAFDFLPLFPPSPGDIDGWRAVLERAPQLEPAVRRMADGMASRVDQLRQLGNGVVSLEGAHAVRTLATRLAARGSAGAAFLAGLMEAAE